MASDLRTDWQRRNFGLRVTHPDIQRAADACEKLVKRIVAQDTLLPLVVLWGNNGCGKTALAKAVARWARLSAHALWHSHGHERPLSVTYVRWPEVCDAFKEGEYGVVSDLMADALVIIDDIGAEHDPSRNAVDKLCQVMSRRESKWTLITTNIEPGMWAEKFDARIQDRLLRRSTIIDMSNVPSFATV